MHFGVSECCSFTCFHHSSSSTFIPLLLYDSISMCISKHEGLNMWHKHITYFRSQGWSKQEQLVQKSFKLLIIGVYFHDTDVSPLQWPLLRCLYEMRKCGFSLTNCSHTVWMTTSTALHGSNPRISLFPNIVDREIGFCSWSSNLERADLLESRQKNFG